jgi:hypothetical protein
MKLGLLIVSIYTKRPCHALKFINDFLPEMKETLATKTKQLDFMFLMLLRCKICDHFQKFRKQNMCVRNFVLTKSYLNFDNHGEF